MGYYDRRLAWFHFRPRQIMLQTLNSWLRNWTRFAALVLALPACYLAYLLGIALGPAQSPSTVPQIQPTSNQLPNGLEVEAADLDLGEVWEDPAFVRPVKIVNRGNKEARVVDMSGGCECTAIEPKAFVLASGQSQSVNVKIDLTHRFPHQFGVDRRELAVTIHPTLADRGASADGWKVLGVIKSRVSLESRGLAFTDLCGQGGPPVTRKMRATTHVPLAGLELSVPTGMGTATARPVPGQTGKYNILVTPNSALPLGPFRFDVAVTAIAPDGVRSPCASFYVEGEMVSPVRIVPSLVLLGEQAVGSKAEAVVSIRFPAADWKVDRVETESADTVVTAIDPIDGLPAYRIVQTIMKLADQSMQVRFVCRKPSGHLETVTIPITYFGALRRKGTP